MDAVLSKSGSDIGPMKRAQIIQRVLVDGWTPAQAATIFELPERRIVRWVKDYRRRGMASLRDPGCTEPLVWNWGAALASAISRYYGGLRRGFGLVEPAPCIPLRYTEEKPNHGRADLA